MIPSEEEHKTIRRYVMYPFLLHVIDRDKEIIANSQLKLKETYSEIFEHVSNRVFADMIKTEDDLRLMNIKIYKQAREKDGIRAYYKYRGYHHDTFYRWIAMREDIKYYIRYYFQE